MGTRSGRKRGAIPRVSGHTISERTGVKRTPERVPSAHGTANPGTMKVPEPENTSTALQPNGISPLLVDIKDQSVERARQLDTNSAQQAPSPAKLEPSDELMATIRDTKSRILAPKVINRCIELLRLKDTFSSSIAVMLILGVTIYLFSLILSLLNTSPANLLSFGSFYGSLIAAFSLWIVKTLHDNILPPNTKMFVDEVVKMGAEVEARAWFHSFHSLRRQLALSIAIGILGTCTLLFVTIGRMNSVRLGTYLVGFLALFAVANGLYCALVIPTLARIIVPERASLFWLNPADSEIIRIFSSAFTRLSIAEAGVVSLCMVGMYWFKPWHSTSAASASIAWLIIGLCAVSYAFIYPHYLLSKAIVFRKRQTLAELQEAMSNYKVQLRELETGDFEALDRFTDLYDRVAQTKETSVRLAAIRGFVTSLLVPIFSYIAGHYDLTKIITQLLSRLP